MTEEKKKLGMTVKQQGVMVMILELLQDMRIRGVHAHLDALLVNRPSHSLVTATIQTLMDEKILELIEFEKVPGKKMKSALYEWHPEIFDACEIVTIKQKKRKATEKKPKDASPVDVEEAVSEDWYEMAKRTRREKMAQRLILDTEIQQLEELIRAIDGDIENVKKFFALRERKTEVKKEDSPCPGKEKRRSPKSCAA